MYRREVCVEDPGGDQRGRASAEVRSEGIGNQLYQFCLILHIRRVQDTFELRCTSKMFNLPGQFSEIKFALKHPGRYCRYTEMDSYR